MLGLRVALDRKVWKQLHFVFKMFKMSLSGCCVLVYQWTGREQTNSF